MESLRVETGDVVVVTLSPDAAASPEDLYAIIKPIWPDNAVIVVPYGMTLAAINEDMMESIGWVRKPSPDPEKPQCPRSCPPK